MDERKKVNDDLPTRETNDRGKPTHLQKRRTTKRLHLRQRRRASKPMRTQSNEKYDRQLRIRKRYKLQRHYFYSEQDAQPSQDTRLHRQPIHCHIPKPHRMRHDKSKTRHRIHPTIHDRARNTRLPRDGRTHKTTIDDLTILRRVDCKGTKQKYYKLLCPYNAPWYTLKKSNEETHDITISLKIRVRQQERGKRFEYTSETKNQHSKISRMQQQP